jgi:hypothetical protein
MLPSRMEGGGTRVKVTVGITQALNTHPFDDNLATVSQGDAFFSLAPSNIDHALRAVGSSHLTTGYIRTSRTWNQLRKQEI